VGVAVDDEMTVTLAQVRLHLRKIDAKIAANRRETDFFRRMGLGRDWKDIQLNGFNALADERAEVLEYLRSHDRRSTKVAKPRKMPLVSWLMIPVVLPLMAIKAVTSKRPSPRMRVQRAGWQSRPSVSFDLG
jgi:hypothetical protein